MRDVSKYSRAVDYCGGVQEGLANIYELLFLVPVVGTTRLVLEDDVVIPPPLDVEVVALVQQRVTHRDLALAISFGRGGFFLLLDGTKVVRIPFTPLDSTVPTLGTWRGRTNLLRCLLGLFLPDLGKLTLKLRYLVFRVLIAVIIFLFIVIVIFVLRLVRAILSVLVLAPVAVRISIDSPRRLKHPSPLGFQRLLLGAATFLWSVLKRSLGGDARRRCRLLAVIDLGQRTALGGLCVRGLGGEELGAQVTRGRVAVAALARLPELELGVGRKEALVVGWATEGFFAASLYRLNKMSALCCEEGIWRVCSWQP